MAGSIAQTIQGEAGSDPAAQFAVASTIYNRIKAGSFPGGKNPAAIVNAPSQFTGFAATPNASARALESAILDGTLPTLGDTGTATYFQSGAAARANGLTAGANIGGNFFSDRFGGPTAGFKPPALAAGAVMADGPPDASSGLNAGFNHSLNSFLAGSEDLAMLGAKLALDAAVPGASVVVDAVTGGGGDQVDVGLKPEATSTIGGWIAGIEGAVGTAFGNAMAGTFKSLKIGFDSLTNWFVRGGLIVLGLIIIFAALAAIMSQTSAGKVAVKAIA